MKKVTIITGNQSTGKTAMAIKMTASKRTVWLRSSDLCYPFLFRSVTPETEVIVIDEVPIKKSFTLINFLITLITSPTIMVNGKGKMAIEIELPEIIIVSNDFKKEDFRERPHLDFIEM